MLLSIGMMVKNEEKYLEKCLNSLKPILNSLDSELIIVDTGSKDSTVEIAKKYTDKVYFHKWNDNFSEMRNITLSYCIGEWFFCIDGDEILENCDDVIKFFKSNLYKNYNSATICVKNFADLDDETNYSALPSLRLFKKDKDFKYVNAIHNQPLYKKPIKPLSTNCNHYGYISTDKELMERKYKRTVSILKNELEKNPNNVYYLCQLAISYSMHNDNIEAIAWIQRAYECIIKEKENIERYIYVYPILCLCYFNIQDYINVEKYAKECLKYDENIIDIYFFLGISLINSKKNEEAIGSFESYLKLYGNPSIRDNNISIISYTLGRINEVYYKLYVLNRDIKEYVKAKKYLLCIDCNNYDVPKSIVELSLVSKEYFILKKYEEELLSKNQLDKVNNLYMYLENVKLKMNFEEAKKITEVFSTGDLAYNHLNKIRVKYENGSIIDINELEIFLDKIDLSSEPFYYGDLLYYFIFNNCDVSKVVGNATFEKINEFMQFSTIKNKCFSEVLYNYILKFVHNEDFYSVRINKEFCRYIILLNNIGKHKLESIYMYYIELGIRYMKYVYSEYVLENECWQVIRTQEEKFFIYINKAKDSETTDEKVFLRYLRIALEAYPCMKNMVAYLLEKQKNSSNDSKFDQYKIQVKNTIKGLIDNVDLENAKVLINEFQKIVKDDIEIYSMNAIIAILENNFNLAENILKDGLELDNNNFDINYNLGYIYEKQGDYFNSIIFYKKALLQIDDKGKRENLQEIIDKIEYREYDDKTIKVIRKYKNQVEEYAKYQMLHKDKYIDPKKFIKLENPIKNNDFKIVFASMEIANTMNLFTQSLRNKSYQAFCINYYPAYLNYKSDFIFDIRNNSSEYVMKKTIEMAAYLISEFDVFHFFFNTSLVPDFSDLIVLKQLNKKVIMNNVGSDIRQYSKAVEMNQYWNLIKDTYFTWINENKNIQTISFFSKYIDNCIVPDDETINYVNNFYKKCFKYQLPMDLEKYNFTDEFKNNGKLLLVHAPTSPIFKGTEYVIKTINNLKENYDFDFILIQNMSHEAAKKLYKKSDIVIDQVIAGSYGGLAVECMAMGKPVIAWISDYMKKKYPEELPIVSANPSNLYEKIEELILDKNKRIQLGIKGREYVEKYNNVNNVVEDLISIYKEI